MARLLVTPKLLEQMLFCDIADGVAIVDASFDQGRQIVVFEVVGALVPDSDEVEAVITKQRTTVVLRSVEAADG